MGNAFSIAAEEAVAAELADDEEPVDDSIHFLFADNEMIAYPPTEGQLALLAAAFDEDDEGAAMAIIKSFLRNVLDYPSYKLIIRLLGQRDSGVGIKQLMQLVKELMQYATGFPTSPSSDSTPSPRRVGTRSTGRSPGKGSTRSTSPRAGSATSSTPGRSKG